MEHLNLHYLKGKSGGDESGRAKVDIFVEDVNIDGSEGFLHVRL